MDVDRYMSMALKLARRGLGRVEPNPMVGCVLVRHGRIVGQGYHRRFGRAHAEVEAIRDAAARGHACDGATMFVTLEPCCHQGKTPPCTEAIIKAGISQVHIAMLDPFEKVAGRGVAELRHAGVDVHVGAMQHEAQQLNAPFIKRVTQGLPWVIAKWAQTIDGRIATRTGQSKWISNEKSRQAVHRLRSRVDAIMVGIGTVLADDPQLNVRQVRVNRRPRAVVVDPSLRTPVDSRLLKVAMALGSTAGLVAGDTTADSTAAGSMADGSAAGPWIAHGTIEDEPMQRRAEQLRQAGATLVALPRIAVEGGEEMAGDATGQASGGQRTSASLDLSPLLRQLVDPFEATHVLVEGGSNLLGHLMAQGLVDELEVFIAPRVLGDDQALAAVGGQVRAQMSQTWNWQLQRTQRFGDDVVLIYRK